MKEKKTPDTNKDRVLIALTLNKHFINTVFIIVLIISFFYVLVTDAQKIISLVNFVISVLSPFILGFCVAYVVNLLLCPLERFWCFLWRKAKSQNVVTKLKRPICLSLSFLLVLGLFFAIVFMIIPVLKGTVLTLVEKMPSYINKAVEWYASLSHFFGNYGFDLPKISLDMEKVGNLVNNFITNYGNSMIDKTVTLTTSIVSVVIDVVLGLVFAIYLLAQKERLGRQTNKVVHTLFKPKTADRMVNLTNLVHGIFTKFVTGQLTEAVIIGVLCLIGMLVFGMPYAAIISVLIGVTALIPIFGAFIGTALGAFLILFESPMKAVWFVIFIIVLQQLESNLIYPKVMGKSVGLPGIWVLCSVTIGGSMFGVLGMLFSVPICSVLYVLFKEYINKNYSKKVSCDETEKIEITED